MSWEMEVQDSFLVAGRGIVVVGKPNAAPIMGPACLTFPDGTRRLVTVIGIERFLKLIDPPMPGENVGLLLRGVSEKVPAGTMVRGG